MHNNITKGPIIYSKDDFKELIIIKASDPSSIVIYTSIQFITLS